MLIHSLKNTFMNQKRNLNMSNGQKILSGHIFILISNRISIKRNFHYDMNLVIRYMDILPRMKVYN